MKTVTFSDSIHYHKEAREEGRNLFKSVVEEANSPSNHTTVNSREC